MRASGEPLILSFDTSTPTGGVALTRGDRVVAARTDTARAAVLLAEIDALLEAAATTLREVELFTATVGPGSFTGLRAGLATVKAFAATLARPVVGVPTLHAVAHTAGPAPRILASLPAGRGEVFAQLLRVAGDSGVEELDGAWHLPPEILFERCRMLRRPLKWVGISSEHKHMMEEYADHHGIAFGDGDEDEVGGGREGWTVIAPPGPAALAEQAALLGLAEYRAGRARGAEALRAIYVRPSDAELNER